MSAEELKDISDSLGVNLSEKDASGLFEMISAHAGEITGEELLKKLESHAKKNTVLAHELDADELNAINGGFSEEDDYTLSSPGKGGCTSSTLKEQCTDTVKWLSWCMLNDYCNKWSSRYTVI